MHPMNRRGFTLIEVLIGILLTVLVSGAIYQTIIASRQLQRTLYAQMDTQQTARASVLFIATALRELDGFAGDLVAATDSSLTYRAMRWTGITCSPLGVSGGNLTVGLRRTQVWGAQVPNATSDSLLLYLERDPATRNDDIWVIGGVSAVAAGTCTDGSTSTNLTFAVRSADGGNSAATAGFRVGAPVRGFQQEQVTLVADGTEFSWLGRRTRANDGTWSAIEPVVGPLVAGTGLRFALFDSLNASTSQVGQAASVAVTVRAWSREVGRFNGVNGRHIDSLVTRVALRNNTRF
jgi:prepilin-type N-terminal cleavage/methylation domain-containing protein